MLQKPALAMQAAHGSPGAIPHTLSAHLCIDFVNSRFTDHTGNGQIHDRLELEEWRRWFLDRCGVASPQPLGVRMRSELVALRDFLRLMLESGRPPDDQALAQLNRNLSRSSQWWELASDRGVLHLQRRWSAAGWRVAVATVVESYARLLVSGDIRRVRVCANPDCSYMFYDESRNASRRWCDVTICGNLLKVRRHRARV